MLRFDNLNVDVAERIAREAVIPELEGDWKFVYDYPLMEGTGVIVKDHVFDATVTLENVIEAACTDYRDIYRDHADRIVGHDLVDLFIEDITVDEVERTVSFGIGS